MKKRFKNKLSRAEHTDTPRPTQDFIDIDSLRFIDIKVMFNFERNLVIRIVFIFILFADGFNFKPDGLDEEVIELGPTESSDILRIQSRLVKNSSKLSQRSRQVIEVKENHQLIHSLNPMIDDPDAIVVK